MRRSALLVLVLTASTGCTLGPTYTRPSAPMPTSFLEQPPAPVPGSGEWKPARPGDEMARGRWWEAFGDSQLAALEARVDVSNQSLAQAEAQFRGARAVVALTRAGLYPSATLGASASRSSGITNRSSAPPGQAPPAVSAYQLPLDLSWEADVFGRVRRSLESSVASAQATAADLETVRLAIHAELAVDYFTLQGLDAQQRLLDTTVAGLETALKLTTNRYNQGVVSGVDVAQAETQLETTRAQAKDLGVARAELAHAIAILVGTPPAELSVPLASPPTTPPEIPVSLPSELLERRPDVAAAERRVAAASAAIGVAEAAYFPSFTLSASGGYLGSELAHLVSLPNRFWSLGAAALETLFDGGRRRAGVAQARASYDAAVAAYRESVLVALQEVEDNLAALRILAEEATLQERAVAPAERALALARNRYQAGITTFLEVVTAQTVALANERTAVDLLTRRQVASVYLVKALGGGWRATDLPGPRAIAARAVPAASGPTLLSSGPAAGPASN